MAEISKIQALKQKYLGKPTSNKSGVKALKERIINGRKWLRENEDHSDFGKNLKLYESLVDEMKSKYGEQEPDLIEELFGDDIEPMVESEQVKGV